MSVFENRSEDDFGEQRQEITVLEAAGDCEVTTTTDVWDGPHLEYDRYGEPTGVRYYRCRDCGREVHEDINRERVSHRDGCTHGGAN